MTEEEYFRKNFPDSCYGDKPLSPYWDFFQYGVEFGERESEKKIQELEETIDKLREQFALRYGLEDKIKELEDKLANADYQLEGRDLEIKELKAQIEKMKCCGNCNNTWNGYHLDVCDDCKNHDKWEIKEND